MSDDATAPQPDATPDPGRDPGRTLTVRVGPNVPEIFVDGYQGVQFKDGVLKLNLYSTQLDPASNASYNDIVGRLTMSVPTLIGIHNALGSLIKDLHKAGAIRIQED